MFVCNKRMIEHRRDADDVKEKGVWGQRVGGDP